MTAANQQIVTAFEELGMTPAEIAQDQELDEVSVKAILMQSSALYRKACKNEDSKEDTFNFSDEELVMANQVISNLARYSEDENMQFRAAKYIRDDRKGRLDVIKQQTGLNINVIAFNEHMQKAIAAVERAKQLSHNSAPVVEVQEA